MKIVINIDDEQVIFDIKNRGLEGESETDKVIINALYNGTPLPKGHGRLIDADAMINKLCIDEASEFFGSVTCAEIMDFINNEKPIIEADKESD